MSGSAANSGFYPQFSNELIMNHAAQPSKEDCETHTQIFSNLMQTHFGDIRELFLSHHVQYLLSSDRVVEFKINTNMIHLTFIRWLLHFILIFNLPTTFLKVESCQHMPFRPFRLFRSPVRHSIPSPIILCSLGSTLGRKSMPKVSLFTAHQFHQDSLDLPRRPS